MSMPQSYTPVTTVHEKEGDSDYQDPSPRGGGGCFRRLCCGWDDGGSHTYLLQEKREEDSWLVTQLKKLKQLSEVVAGPKWKNMVRKIGKLCKCKRYNKETAAQFQYSPESYALNFAGNEDREGDDNLMHSFSMRFAPQGLHETLSRETKHNLSNDNALKMMGVDLC